jgi:hypothetical protein
MTARRPLRLIVTAPACHSGGFDDCGAPHCNEATCMRLPARAACGACLWIETCLGLGETRRESTVCTFFPRRFVRDLEP